MKDRNKFGFLPTGEIIHFTSNKCVKPYKNIKGEVLLSLKQC